MAKQCYERNSFIHYFADGLIAKSFLHTNRGETGMPAKRGIPVERHAMASQFARDYLVLSIIPLLILCVIVVTGIIVTRNYLADLIVQSTAAMNADAEHGLQALGEDLIRTKAEDVAKQIEVYVHMHPERTIAQMRQDPLFMELAIQKVGETGYTAITESPSWLFRAHPNAALNDTDMHGLAEKLPDWWRIIESANQGVETSGYYDWLDPDGTVRKKYMAFSPIAVPVQGATLMVAATTYIDEFSAPIIRMSKRADDIVSQYQKHISRQLTAFGAVAVFLLLVTFASSFVLMRRSVSLYIHPITSLADAVGELGGDNWRIPIRNDLLRRMDEIGTLAHALGNMSQKVSELILRLESRVRELKQTQAALEESEAHFRNLFDSVPVGLYRTTTDGQVLDANSALADMLGFPNIDVLKRQNADRLYLDQQEREHWRSQLEDGGEIYVSEKNVRKYDGSTIWIENQARAVRDEKGQAIYYEGSLKDITERKAAEEALKANEEQYKRLYEESKRMEARYRSLIHSSPDPIVIYDLQGHVQYISPMFTKVFQWSFEEIKDQTIPFVPEFEQEATQHWIREVVEHGKFCHGFETKRITKSGQLIDVSISASRYDDHEGMTAGMLVILRDITERKRIEAQLQHIERMEAIGTLAGGIAHDFNNLLMAIMGNATLLKQKTTTGELEYRALSRIEEQVQRGSQLTQQLLGYARKGKYQVKTIGLNDIVRENTGTIKRTRKDISIYYDLAADLSNIEADAYQIEQVLMNLFINASDAMPDGGDLFLTTRNVPYNEVARHAQLSDSKKYVFFSVADTGVGMDQKTMGRIFDPFFTTKEMGRGTGLGLSSVYGIVKSHGGYIEVDSAIGKGTTFKIYLPASTKPEQETKKKPQPLVGGEGTILLVDDEEVVLEVTAKLIQSLGYRVIKAAGGNEAIEHFEKKCDSVDLVILDMIMPDMSGRETFDRLRFIDPNARILLSSGYSIDGKAAEIMNRGCKGFIQKPYSIGQLADKIDSILGKGT